MTGGHNPGGQRCSPGVWRPVARDRDSDRRGKGSTMSDATLSRRHLLQGGRGRGRRRVPVPRPAPAGRRAHGRDRGAVPARRGQRRPLPDRRHPVDPAAARRPDAGVHAGPAGPGRLAGRPRRAVPAGGAGRDAPARPELAHSVHVDARGLQPGHEYFYRFRALGELQPGRADQDRAGAVGGPGAAAAGDRRTARTSRTGTGRRTGAWPTRTSTSCCPPRRLHLRVRPAQRVHRPRAHHPGDARRWTS